ncbi:MAG: sugar ABC transporter permease [Chromatiales bacterium]|nr:sugar ABC transporter permease [Chromatiales bacterium]
MAYFTPTILPMIAVANIWLFFYTPQIGLLDKLGGALRRWPATTGSATPSTALGCLMVMAVWKEAGLLHDLLPGGAAGACRPSSRRRRRSRAPARWYFFRRVTLPLLMPTTLFVLVNATINSFKLVDHIFILTKGGPDNASSLLLYYIYEVALQLLGHGLRRRRSTVVLLAMLARAGGHCSSCCIEKRVHYR